VFSYPVKVFSLFLLTFFTLLFIIEFINNPIFGIYDKGAFIMRRKKSIAVLFSLFAITSLSALALTSCSDNAVFEEIFDENGESTHTARLVSLSGTKHYTVPETWNEMPVVEIGENALNSCGQLVSITIPACVENICLQSFHFGLRIESVNYLGSEHYKSQDGVLFSGDGKTLLYYPRAKRDVSYTTPDGVENIASQAFAELKYLSELTIGDSVTEMEAFAVDTVLSNGTSNFRKLSIAADFLGNQSEIEDDYQFCVSGPIIELDIYKGAFIPDEALLRFENNLEKVTLPENLLSIGNDFRNDGLKELVLPETVQTIGDNFCMNTKITEMTLPSSLRTLGGGSFGNCDLLTELTIPDSVEIDTSRIDCFGGGGLRSVTGSLKVLDKLAFDALFDLETVTVTKLAPQNDEHLYQLGGKHVIFGEAVTSIPSELLHLINDVKKVSFLGNLRSIYAPFIDYSSVTEIYLPASVTHVEADAINARGGQSLTVYCYGAEGSFTVNEAELENVTFVWNYVDPEPDPETSEQGE
jgi:hypothetical protein